MLYKVVNQFGPHCGESWQKYLEFSGLFQIKEFCSLDSGLNHSVFEPITQEDWDNCVKKDSETNFIDNIDYARKIQKQFPSSRMFGCIIAPKLPIHDKDLLGYDIIDGECGNSLLTNCGGFPDILNIKIINNFGLISDFKMAFEIKDKLRDRHSENPHTRTCEVWGIIKAT